MKKIKELKQILKDWGKELRQLKDSRKENVRKRPLWKIESDIFYLRREVRHHHIAYCEMRGTPYAIIECHCNEKPNRDYIDKIKGKFKEDETVCSDS